MGIGCCGATWGIRRTTVSHDDPPAPIPIEPAHDEVRRSPYRPEIPDANGQAPSRTVMNLAAALAAEREVRAGEGFDVGAVTPSRVSLMKLLEKSEGANKEAEGCDWVCCVCMGRRKGAAFIPCGHTFCRVCSRELWVNRGSCPLCNRLIIEVLDIF